MGNFGALLYAETNHRSDNAAKVACLIFKALN